MGACERDPYSLNSGPLPVITPAENGVFHLERLRMSQRRFRSWEHYRAISRLANGFHVGIIVVASPPGKVEDAAAACEALRRSSMERCQNDHHDDPGAKALELGKACCVLKSTETALRFYLSSVRPTESPTGSFARITCYPIVKQLSHTARAVSATLLGGLRCDVAAAGMVSIAWDLLLTLVIFTEMRR